MLVLRRRPQETVRILNATITAIWADHEEAKVDVTTEEGTKRLTLKRGEEYKLCDGITMVFTRLDGDGARFGFDAPKNVKIMRGEIAE